jgi:hypothetical protein
MAGKIEYAEVQFYFLHFTADNEDKLPVPSSVPNAVVSVYSCPVQSMLDESCNTLWACRYTGMGGLHVIKLSSILSCVSIQPLPILITDPEGPLWFMLEKSGLEDVQLTGPEEPMEANLQ